MGLTHVTVTLRNLARRERTYTGIFLVDTGAYDSLVPAEAVEALGLDAAGDVECELADGTPQRFRFGVCQIEFMGEVTGGRVLFGSAGIEPLLGVTALESVGITVDPRTQTLKRLPAIPLK